MLFCGAFALLAGLILGLGRLIRARRRLVIGLAGVLLAAGPLVALAAEASADRPGDRGWAAAMLTLCGRGRGGQDTTLRVDPSIPPKDLSFQPGP